MTMHLTTDRSPAPPAGGDRLGRPAAGSLPSRLARRALPARLAGRALLCAATAVAAAPAAALGNDPGDATGPLRVCADPDNLPFSSASGPRRGFYLDLAERLVQALGHGAQPVLAPRGDHEVESLGREHVGERLADSR